MLVLPNHGRPLALLFPPDPQQVCNIFVIVLLELTIIFAIASLQMNDQQKLYFLSEMFPGAEKDIIRDVLSGANNSVDEAATLLSQMNFTEAPKNQPPAEKSESKTPLPVAAPFTFAPLSPLPTSPAETSFLGFSAPAVESHAKGLLSPASGGLATPIPLGPASKPKTSPSKHGKGASKTKKQSKSLGPTSSGVIPAVTQPLSPSTGTVSSADEWRAKTTGRGPNRFSFTPYVTENDKLVQEAALRSRKVCDLIDSIAKPPIADHVPNLDPLQIVAAYCLSFGPHLRSQMESHAKNNSTASPFSFLLESHPDRVWFDYCEKCVARVSQEFNSTIPYNYEKLLPYKYSDHE